MATQAAPPQPSGEASDRMPAIPRGVHGWSAWLFHHSQEYRELVDEVRQGKESPAMNHRAKETAAYLASAKQDPSMHAAKMGKYAEWARESLPRTEPAYFRKHVGGAATAPRFLDLGAAPGGLSCFLHGDLGWQGVAVSLDEARGGMPMMYTGKPKAAATAALAGGPGRPVSTLKSPFAARLLKKGNSAQPEKAGAAFRCTTGDVRSEDEMGAIVPSGDPAALETASAAGGDVPRVAAGSCDFAMAGAVQDQSQREGGPAGDSSGGNDAMSMQDLFVAQLRQRLAFVVEQLRVVHRALKRDGTASLMLVMGPAECASVAVVARLLQQLSRDGRVRVLGTMHIDKPPVYLLVRNLRFDGDAAAKWETLLDPEALAQHSIAVNAGAAAELGSSAFAGLCDPTDAEAAFEAAKATWEGTGFSEDLCEVFTARRQRLASQRKRAEERYARTTDAP